MVTMRWSLLCPLILLHSIRCAHSAFLGLGEDACHSESVVRPNIVFIILDDLGFADLSLNNGRFSTPHMDSLVNNSVQLKRHYVHLMGSPSRTQYLTGRYAMNLGFGEFGSWRYQRLLGIPVGQPTIAQWLSEFGTYTTYAVGKWNLGYANERMLPQNKGFHHFYGFYQGAVDYRSKKYYDVDDGQTEFWDFWEDGDECYDAISNENSTLLLYADKIGQYLAAEGEKRKNRRLLSKRVEPFFLYAAIQSMHDPFTRFADFEEQCTTVLNRANTESTEYQLQRLKYCELTLYTDYVIGEIVGSLKQHKLWENTLIVFSSDNGGATFKGASNYPSRGTKGESFEGNVRVIAAVSGGIVEAKGLVGHSREAVVSNLDWTPTLLHFAGYLKCIDPADYSWDGVDQYALILGHKKKTNEREYLVLNIGDTALVSASVLVKESGVWWKYINQNAEQSASDVWSNSADTTGGVWSEFYSGTLRIRKLSGNDSGLLYSGPVQLEDSSKGYLFQLDSDVSEQYNLIDDRCHQYDRNASLKVLDTAKGVLKNFIATQPLFTPPIEGFHDQLEAGNPEVIGDGKWVRPFLSNEEYLALINDAFDRAALSGSNSSEALRSLYSVSWKVPDALPSSSTALFTKVIVILIIAAALLAICCTVVMYYCNRSRRQRYGPYTYTPIKDDEMEHAPEPRTEVYIYS